MNKPLTEKKLIEFLERALDLLQVSGPNPITIGSTEYWKAVHALQDELAPYLE